MQHQERRHMRPYHPRTPRHEKVIEKQKLGNLEHLISMDLGNFLVLLEEGNTEQIGHAKEKAKSDLIKFKPEMQKIAEKIGGKIPSAVDEFLDSIDAILHSAPGWVDELKISRCYHLTQKLEKELH
jgi:hypothetical protein